MVEYADIGNDLESLLNEIDSLATVNDQTTSTTILLRSIGEDEIVEDSLPIDEEYLGDEGSSVEVAANESSTPRDFSSSQGGPIVAVDCGIARLGETEKGLVIALRATIASIFHSNTTVNLFRSGPIYLHNEHRLELMHRMGEHLGKADHFVELNISDSNNPRPIRLKSGVAFDSHKYGDRFRNWFERLVQKIAVTKIKNGVVLLDGALTLRTLDTPDNFIQNLANTASDYGNALVAISKQSLLQVQGRAIRFWLDDAPNRPCYRRLTSYMHREEHERVLGSVYAARFSAVGPVFRMDVNPAVGQSEEEAINQFWSSALMRVGYPDILVRAHTHSYFTSPDVIELQAQAAAKYKLAPRGEVDLSAIFGPFGGRFK